MKIKMEKFNLLNSYHLLLFSVKMEMMMQNFIVINDFFFRFLNDLFIILFLVAFQIYDIDRDGFISNGELFTVLQKMVGDNLSPEQVIRF